MSVLLASVHCVSFWVNTGEQNRCHTHLSCTYFIASKFANASECDIGHEKYHGGGFTKRSDLELSFVAIRQI